MDDGRRLAFPLPASRSRSGWLLLRLRLRGGEAERCPSAREEERGGGVPSASTAPDFLTPPAGDQSKPNQRICGAGRMRRRSDRGSARGWSWDWNRNRRREGGRSRSQAFARDQAAQNGSRRNAAAFVFVRGAGRGIFRFTHKSEHVSAVSDELLNTSARRSAVWERQRGSIMSTGMSKDERRHKYLAI